MSEEVRRRFSRIASKYDFMNHFLSMGVDRKWRAAAAGEAMLDKKRYRVLDVATGTGDLALAIDHLAKDKGKDVEIVATDFTPAMLKFANEKVGKQELKNIRIEVDDVMHMKQPAASFDVVTAGFLLRSLDDLDGFIREVRRVLKKGGKVILLDMATPETPHQKRFFRQYSYFMRFVALFSDREAYNWLVDSINRFDKKGLLKKMRNQGFRKVITRPLSSGIGFIVTAEK